MRMVELVDPLEQTVDYDVPDRIGVPLAHLSHLESMAHGELGRATERPSLQVCAILN